MLCWRALCCSSMHVFDVIIVGLAAGAVLHLRLKCCGLFLCPLCFFERAVIKHHYKHLLEGQWVAAAFAHFTCASSIVAQLSVLPASGTIFSRTSAALCWQAAWWVSLADLISMLYLCVCNG